MKAKELTVIGLSELFKRMRDFDAPTYLDKKIILLDKFFRKNKIDSVVIGISGGVDSAVVFHLLCELKRRCDSLKAIMPIFIPIYGAGITGQHEARIKAMSVFTDKAYPFYEVDLTGAAAEVVNGSTVVTGPKEYWAYGQMSCILRTSVLYYHAAMLQTRNFKSLVVGTTNRDEGAYIGFFGKASDAAVDLQPIADLHKSEVYTLAAMLNVNYKVIDSVPKGDVWDSKVDTEMIGAPYWFLEAYIHAKEYDYAKEFEAEAEAANMMNYIINIEELHRINKHKYQVGNPAHFVDVMKRKVEGGWK